MEEAKCGCMSGGGKSKKNKNGGYVYGGKRKTNKKTKRKTQIRRKKQKKRGGSGMSLSHSYPYNTEISSRPEIAGPVSGGKKKKQRGGNYLSVLAGVPQDGGNVASFGNTQGLGVQQKILGGEEVVDPRGYN
jgi:hypothetical protein|tara:strand:+ start:200 stop:595 length:396 start_codon:yes stop_codon:yes gene_type:complete